MLAFVMGVAKILPKTITLRSLANITTSKTLADKKKKIYSSQLAESVKVDTQVMNAQERRAKEMQFQKLLLEVSKEMALVFASRSPAQKKKTEIASQLAKLNQRVAKQQKILDIRELIHYVQVVKGMCFIRLDQLQHIEIVYKELQKFMSIPQHKQSLKDLLSTLWRDSTPLQLKIRAVCLLQFMEQSDREHYLSQVVPLIRYFKSSEMLILFYEKWRFKYHYSYELIDEIHGNQYYGAIEDINQAQFKMLFVETLKGSFGPNDDGIYTRVLNAVNQKPTVLAHTAFSALIKMLHSQNYFVQTEASRSSLEFSLNNFINIAKNQNYEHSTLTLPQLVDIYLSFEQNSSTGEILLNEITYFSRINNFVIEKHNFPLYQKLLLSVLRNIDIKLKYQRRDFLNKEYTNDTINFLKEFIPKYLELWPGVILEVNNAAHQLFAKKDDPILAKFASIFKDIVAKDNSKLNLSNIVFLKKVLEFLKTYENRKMFELPEETYMSIIKQFENKPHLDITCQQLEILYLTLSLLGDKVSSPAFKNSIEKINKNLLEPNIQKEISRQKVQSIINSLDDEIIWLSLCSALLKHHNFSLDESLLQIFVNQKLFFMINSLKYLQVYQILAFTVNLSRIRAEVYERLLFNLSTFVIYINQKSVKPSGPGNFVSPYYLNHKYLQYYPKIIRLVLENQSIFRGVQNKNAFRIVQIMFYNNIAEYQNEDLLKLLDILSDQNVLINSLINHIENIKFSPAQLEPYEHSRGLKHFQYYNKSLLRYFQGKYNQSEIKNRLRQDTLTRHQIAQYFSKIEVYKTIIMDGELNIRFDMPEPRTSIPDFKFMYTCQRIFQRIKMFNDYDFKEDSRYKSSEGVEFNDVDFTTEKKYIQNEVLIPNTSFNQFRLENRALPKYIKLEVWKSYLFVDNNCLIDRKDFQLNQRKLIDEILNKVIKGAIYGSYEKIREVYKEFICNEDLVNAIRDSKIQFQQYGAAIQLKGQADNELILLCSNNTNYKILYICAHFIAKNGKKVFVLKEKQKLEPLISFLKAHFVAKENQQVDSQVEKLKEDENESDNQE